MVERGGLRYGPRTNKKGRRIVTRACCMRRVYNEMVSIQLFQSVATWSLHHGSGSLQHARLHLRTHKGPMFLSCNRRALANAGPVYAQGRISNGHNRVEAQAFPVAAATRGCGGLCYPVPVTAHTLLLGVGRDCTCRRRICHGHVARVGRLAGPFFRRCRHGRVHHHVCVDVWVHHVRLKRPCPLD